MKINNSPNFSSLKKLKIMPVNKDLEIGKNLQSLIIIAIMSHWCSLTSTTPYKQHFYLLFVDMETET